MKCIICRGLPGSGKSTFSNRVFGDVIKVENDMFFRRDLAYAYDVRKMPDAVRFCDNAAELALSSGCDCCVVVNTFTRRAYIEKYRKMAEKYGAELVVYRLTGAFDNAHGVPRTVFDNMKNKFEDWPGEILVRPVEDGSYTYEKA